MHMGQGIASPIAYPPNYQTLLLYWNLNDLIQTDHHFIDTHRIKRMFTTPGLDEIIWRTLPISMSCFSLSFEMNADKVLNLDRS